MPHDIEVDWWAEVLSDSNCCVQVDDHVPPAARDKHSFTRTVENLKLQWEQKWKHATSRDKISYGKRELWEREGVAQSSPGDMWMSQKLLLDDQTLELIEVGFRRGSQTFIQCCQERIQ